VMEASSCVRGGAISAKWRKIIARGRATAVRPRRVVDGSAAVDPNRVVGEAGVGGGGTG
jgi:hypothetical protein